MKKLLVPTDFSDNALSALLFALELAPVLQANLEVVHVYELPASEDPALRKTVSKWMHSFVEKARKKASASAAGVSIETSLIEGLTEPQLIQQSYRKEIDMMILGAEGAGGIGKKWFGSVAETVARQAQCPVLLIPEGQAFSGFRQILFASDYQAAEPSVLDLLTGFAPVFHASIHFVHVEKAGEDSEYARIEQRILDYLFRNGTPSFSFQMTCLHAGDIESGLEDYAVQNEIDLLVMVATQRSFWETLFHHSHTKEMILRLKLPLMVVHLKD